MHQGPNQNNPPRTNWGAITKMFIGAVIIIGAIIYKYFSDPALSSFDTLDTISYFGKGALTLIGIAALLYLVKHNQTANNSSREVEALLKQAQTDSKEVENLIAAINSNYGIDFDLGTLPAEYKTDLGEEFKLIQSQFTCVITHCIARDPMPFRYTSRSASNEMKSFTEIYDSTALLGHIHAIDARNGRYTHPTSNIVVGRDALMASTRFDHSKSREELLTRLQAFAVKAATIKSAAHTALSSASTSAAAVASASASATLAPATLQASDTKANDGAAASNSDATRDPTHRIIHHHGKQ